MIPEKILTLSEEEQIKFFLEFNNIKNLDKNFVNIFKICDKKTILEHAQANKNQEIIEYILQDDASHLFQNNRFDDLF